MPSAKGSSRSNVKKRDQAKRDKITDEIVIKALMKDRDGRRWVWLRLAEARIYVPTTDLDPYKLAYEAGLKAVALRLNAAVTRFAPDMYVEMLKENSRLEQILEDLEKEEEVDRPEPSQFD